MSSIVPIKFGPFDRGLMNGLDPALLPRGAAQTATNLDLSRGTLRGIYTPGDDVGTVDTTTPGSDLRAFYYISDSEWRGSLHEQWACPDYDLANNVQVLYTNEYTGSTPRTPDRTATFSGDSERLGLDGPGDSTVIVASAGSGSTAISRSYAVVFRFTTGNSAGWVSNPSFSGHASIAGDVAVTVPVSSDGRSGIVRDIYATENGDPDGTLYYLGNIPNNTGTSFIDDLSVDLDRSDVLNWEAGGSYDASPYLFDHAPWPDAVTLFADGIHSAAAGVTAPGSGILFAASYNQVLYGQAGFPYRRPLRNAWATPDDVRAIIVEATRATIFAGSAVYAATGFDDNALRFERLQAEVGIRAACGKTAHKTPFGIPYVSHQGLMMLQGGQAVPLADESLTPDYWAGLATQAGGLGGGFVGGYQSRVYYVFGGDKTVIIDLTRWPTVAITESDVVVTAAYQMPFDGSVGQGLYVAKKNDRNGSSHPYIRPWMHDNPAGRSSTRAAWIYKSPRLAGINGGPQGLDKRARRLRIRKTGTPTVKVYYDGSLVVNRQLVTTNPDGTTQGEGIDWIQLPAQRWKTLEVQIEGAGASDEVYDFEIDVVPYAA